LQAQQQVFQLEPEVLAFSRLLFYLMPKLYFEPEFSLRQFLDLGGYRVVAKQNQSYTITINLLPTFCDWRVVKIVFVRHNLARFGD
jgi:hypothetical protein